MTTIRQIVSITGVAILAVLSFNGCMIDRFDSNYSTLSDDELRFTGQIIGESVSESENGVLSSFSEAFAIPAPGGLVPGNSLFPTVRIGQTENYTYSYDAGNGTHLARFSQNRFTTGAQVATDFELSYIFRTADGSLIESPGSDSDAIESVDFTARRTGSIETLNKTSYFTRTDHLIIDGLNSRAPILAIDGFHSGDGSFTRTDSNGVSFQRDYVLEMNLMNIRIDRARVETSRNFRTGVYGALSYESTITQSGPGNPETKIVNGTLEFNGDGTALLRFIESADIFRVRLQSGELFDEDEFEGRIVKAAPDQNLFTLANGQRILIDGNTEIDDDGDYLTLTEVSIAMQNGISVKAEGDYFQPDPLVNQWIATGVGFERESNEFEDIIESVDLLNGSFLLVNGDRYYLNAESKIDDGGDFLTLQDVDAVVMRGLPVEAEGAFYIDSATSRRIVREVEFELELLEIEEIVQSVDPEDQSFTTDTGKRIFVTSDTVFGDDSDYKSLEEVADAIIAGFSVEAECEIYRDPDSGFWIAIEVQFERN